MNELIKRLADEVRFTNELPYPDQDTIFQRFAELIVKECLEQVRDEVQYEYDWNLADAVTKRVIDHFGVK